MSDPLNEPTTEPEIPTGTPDATATDRTADELPAVETLTYEQARDELVAIVARLESGQLDLEASMALWERGEALAARCTRWLDGAQARLQGAEHDSDPGAGLGPDD